MFGCIKIVDGNMNLVKVVDLEHNTKNIDKLAARHEVMLGNITHKNDDSDCITIVTYERGILGFSI
ncbi:MAG TPA: hypothetical protein IAA29_11990 [Candidatus Paenibacillus intestinavium]|nr:hypothetical protein [Candidatus Paenibacillus intestinavium]